ncbi:MarR family transcriptional regulator [Streptomyces sp. ODS28]|uniref:MarR family winged helix-turn-helix transcriptional regulator n=1 Tax=Streptomyces sp. ODS28 TaxID=3136688 RepID=UPI0031E98785
MDTAADLSRLLGPLRRAVLRSTRAAENLPDLPEAHIELLRVLVAWGPLGTRSVAARLRVSPSTVSNLVRSATADGLVRRQASETDLRAVELTATDRARELLDRYDAASRDAIEQALARLPRKDRDTLAEALPALERLTTELSER